MVMDMGDPPLFFSLYHGFSPRKPSNGKSPEKSVFVGKKKALFWKSHDII
jgi:hypothetical protein